MIGSVHLPEWELPHEPENDGSDYAATFSARKPKIQKAAQKMLALLDRDPPPTYPEVADAIDRIHRENDKR